MRSGGPAGSGGQGEGLGGLAGLGGELLEAGRSVQGEEPYGGRGDDVGVPERLASQANRTQAAGLQAAEP